MEAEYRMPDGEHIYRTECQYCFKTHLNPNGLCLCLFCDTACCEDHIGEHVRLTGHKEFTRITFVPKDDSVRGSLQELIKTSTLDELGEYQNEVVVFSDNYLVQVPEPTDDQLLSSALLFDSPADESRRYLKAAITDNNMYAKATCSHIYTITPHNTGAMRYLKCSCCELEKNLWMCLSCGYLNCGRKQFDGTGGNGHAVEHYDKTKHPLAIKLTSCCKDCQELYCYACDDEPQMDLTQLRKILDYFYMGYILDRNNPQELSLQDQAAQNQLEAVRQKTMSGITVDERVCLENSIIPFENTGNTCYANATINALIGAKQLQKQRVMYLYPRYAPVSSAIFNLQKVLNYVHPRGTPATYPYDQPHLTELLLSMNTYLTEKCNAGKYYDAREFLYFIYQRFGNVLSDHKILASRKEVECNACHHRQYTEGAACDYLTLTCNFFDHSCSTAETNTSVDIAEALAREYSGVQRSVYNFKCKNCGEQNTEGQEQVVRVGYSFLAQLPETLTVVANRLFYDYIFGKICKLKTKLVNASEIDLSCLYAKKDNEIEELRAVIEAARAYVSNDFSEDYLLCALHQYHTMDKATQALRSGSVDFYASYTHLDLVKRGNYLQNALSKYTLSSFIEHRGQSYDCGHYVAYVRNGDGKWFEVNDEKVAEIESPPIEDAYILFYERTK